MISSWWSFLECNFNKAQPHGTCKVGSGRIQLAATVSDSGTPRYTQCIGPVSHTEPRSSIFALHRGVSPSPGQQLFTESPGPHAMNRNGLPVAKFISALWQTALYPEPRRLETRGPRRWPWEERWKHGRPLLKRLRTPGRVSGRRLSLVGRGYLALHWMRVMG